MYVVLCQDTAIFYESKTAFLARTPHAARCQEKTFFFSRSLLYLFTYSQVKKLSQKHMWSYFPAESGCTKTSMEGRRQGSLFVADSPSRHASFCSSVFRKWAFGLCVPESTPTRGAHKLEGTWLICRQTGRKVLPWFSLHGSNHSSSESSFFF